MTTREDRIKSYNNFVELRLKKNFKTDSEVARRAGMNQSSFTDWKNGVSQPNALHLLQIAKVLKVSPTKLL